MIRRPPRSTLSSSSAASDVYKRQGVGGYGISMTTLEECFIRVAEEADDEACDETLDSGDLSKTEQGQPDATVPPKNYVLKLDVSPDHGPQPCTSPSEHKLQEESPRTHATVVPLPPVRTANVSSRRVQRLAPLPPVRADDQIPADSDGVSAEFPPPSSDDEGAHQPNPLDVKPDTPRPLFQLWVQYRKRVTISLRDPRALFYEVFLPVILVFGVMMILHVEFDPAGPSIRLSPNLMSGYGDTKAHLLNWWGEPATSEQLRTTAEVPFTDDENPTSYWLGENVLLPEISSHPKWRMGSVVFNDYFNGGSNLTISRVNSSQDLSASSGVGTGSAPSESVTFTINSTVITVTNASTIQTDNQTISVDDAQGVLDSASINLNLTKFIEDSGTTSSEAFTLSIDNGTRTVNLNNSALNFSVVLNETALNAISPDLVSILFGLGSEYSYGIFSKMTVMFNATSPHALPGYMAQAVESHLKSLRGSSASFAVNSHPLPLTNYQSAVIKGLLSLFASLFLLVPFCYLPASYSMFVVKERTGMVKHVMLVSGQDLNTYWASNLLWDLTQYSFVMASCMLVFLAFPGNIFTKNGDYISGMMALLALYGLASIPLAYCYSFMFKTHASSQIGIATINFCTGWVTVVAYYVMSAVEGMESTTELLDNIYSCFPPYVLGRALLTMSEQAFREDVLGDTRGIFDWEVLGRYLFLLTIHSGVLIPGVLIIERFLMTECADSLQNCLGVLRMRIGACQPAVVEDDEDTEGPEPAGAGDLAMRGVSVVSNELDHDVLVEQEFVSSGAARDDGSAVLVIDNLYKLYPPRGNQPSKVAVDHLSVSVSRGSCFGLLGINGAGKSTTMAMLTGDVRPTSGDAYVNGHSIRKSMRLVRKDIGFCPQFDSLSESLTALENLVMYADIKGIPSEHVRDVAQQLVDLVGLTKFQNRQAGTYSGGNKRKLSLAIALIGNPSLVMLDEPSTGMDPVARRQMWTTIERTASNRSVVLTTHSMEECEALCDRVVVMVKGQFRCLGSIQHLKSRFGEGYTCLLYTSDAADEEDSVDLGGRRIIKKKKKKKERIT
eukprot:TRINITY_DN8110_c0_g1_i15.p1 TRINITY_DN8110_c0_g1~~TRINITY_DN8110_c0_g1_i15.p1  ORF type:complete len:1065 (-),score=233.23 TRINITY_DN8110_c0_g1_i15:75-3269(-)